MGAAIRHKWRGGNLGFGSLCRWERSGSRPIKRESFWPGAYVKGRPSYFSTRKWPMGWGLTGRQNCAELPISGLAFGSDDAFIAKFNKLGQMVWMKSFGSDKSDVAFRVAADEDCQAIYVGGHSAACMQLSMWVGGPFSCAILHSNQFCC